MSTRFLPHGRALSIGQAIPYLLSLVLPVTTTVFFVVPAHRGWVAVGWLASLVAIAVGDEVLPPIDRRTLPAGGSVARLADVVVVLQLANFLLFIGLLGRGSIGTKDTALAVLLVGVGGAFSSMIAAHELIHRRPGLARWLGRMLLWTAFYDHFFTDHLRGHHRTVGTAADVLTARRDETFFAYLVRSWPGEIRSAWRLGLARHANRSRFGALASSEVVRGIVAELALVVVIGVYGGPVIVALVVAQAALAHLLVGAVNFFEHWGIVRTGGKPGAAHAWDTTAPLSHYALLGLSFHADHHARVAQPFDRLVLREESPKLPNGYFALVAMVLLRNAHVRRLLGAELSRRTGDVGLVLGGR